MENQKPLSEYNKKEEGLYKPEPPCPLFDFTRGNCTIAIESGRGYVGCSGFWPYSCTVYLRNRHRLQSGGLPKNE